MLITAQSLARTLNWESSNPGQIIKFLGAQYFFLLTKDMQLKVQLSISTSKDEDTYGNRYMTMKMNYFYFSYFEIKNMKSLLCSEYSNVRLFVNNSESLYSLFLFINSTYFYVKYAS